MEMLSDDDNDDKMVIKIYKEHKPYNIKLQHYCK